MSTADGEMTNEVLIEVGGLRAQMYGSNPPLVLDVRWALGDPDGASHYSAEHISRPQRISGPTVGSCPRQRCSIALPRWASMAAAQSGCTAAQA
jgi:hypothetical protein